MTAFELAWRSAARNRTRAALAVAGVATIGALLFNMLLLSRGLLVSFRDLLDTAGFDVRVLALEGSMVRRLPIGHVATFADAIGRLPSVQRVALVRTDRAQVAAADGATAPIDVSLIGVGGSPGTGVWDIVSGSTLPADVPRGDPIPVIVNTRLAAALRLEPGSALRASVALSGAPSALPVAACRVVGIGHFAFESSSDHTVATTMKGFATVHGAIDDDEADVVLVASRGGDGGAAAARAIAALRPDLRVYSNDQVMEQFNENAFAYFRQISAVLSSMTLAFAFLLVATLLTMSVNQRLGEMAALRALGFSRRRIAANLLCESAVLVGSGGLLALPAGGALALVLDRILRQMPGMPARLHFFVLEPRAVILHVSLLALTGLLAALYPIWIATRLPIAATLRRELVS